MKILLEDTIPFGQQYLAELGDITPYAWQSLGEHDLSNVDIMAVRSTTKINAATCSSAKRLKFVTTATSGTNHMDKAWLDENGIKWGSAAGCNAVAVAEYVISVVLQAGVAGKLDISSCTVGIVGAGHVGTALAKRLDALNIQYKLCDPPLVEAGDARKFVSFEQILECDVISLHVPFVKSGVFSTGHLIDAAALAKLNASQLLVNACRGEVVDEAALLARLAAGDAPTVALDVFANEPTINIQLLDKCWLVTPHIAGHSVEGKVRGTQFIYEQICQFAAIRPAKTLDNFLTPVAPLKVALDSPEATQLSQSDLTALMLSVYDVNIDDGEFRNALTQELGRLPEGTSDKQIVASIGHTFATMRKGYRIRRECCAYRLLLPSATSAEIKQQLQTLGFFV